METFKILVVGTRTFENYNKLQLILDFLLKHKQDREIEIVSGGAMGADSLAERYAMDRGYKLKVFQANWDFFGKMAGAVRNQQMRDYIGTENCACVAFWDGESRGTSENFADLKKRNIQTVIFNYKDGRLLKL